MDYKKYSLEQLENWIHDALSCDDVTPHEIYNKIKGIVVDQKKYHSKNLNRCEDLLNLLNGHLVIDLDLSNIPNRIHYSNPVTNVGYGSSNNVYTFTNDKVNDSVGISSTSFVNFNPWTDNVAAGSGTVTAYSAPFSEPYTFTLPNHLLPKNNKWVSSVKEGLMSDKVFETETYVTLPNDMLAKANIKQGDKVELVEQTDGSYVLRKV